MSEFVNEETLNEVVGGAARPTADPGPGYQWYQIVKGDTLTRIAKRFGTDVKTLQTLNAIKNASLIIKGTWIKVPQ